MLPGDTADRERETRFTAVAQPANRAGPGRHMAGLVADFTFGHVPKIMPIATLGNFGRIWLLGGDVAESFFWRLARAALCCPVACKPMKTW